MPHLDFLGNHWHLSEIQVTFPAHSNEIQGTFRGYRSGYIKVKFRLHWSHIQVLWSHIQVIFNSNGYAFTLQLFLYFKNHFDTLRFFSLAEKRHIQIFSLAEQCHTQIYQLGWAIPHSVFISLAEQFQTQIFQLWWAVPHSNFLAWLSSATLRFFSLNEQCHSQNF